MDYQIVYLGITCNLRTLLTITRLELAYCISEEEGYPWAYQQCLDFTSVRNGQYREFESYDFLRKLEIKKEGKGHGCSFKYFPRYLAH